VVCDVLLKKLQVKKKKPRKAEEEDQSEYHEEGKNLQNPIHQFRVGLLSIPTGTLYLPPASASPSS